MSKIGTLRRSAEQNNNNLYGNIRTLGHSARLCLEPNPRAEAQGQPAYNAYAITADGELVNIGAAWAKESNGRKYFSMSLDDPSWAASLSCAAFPTDKAGEWDVVWNRPERAAA